MAKQRRGIESGVNLETTNVYCSHCGDAFPRAMTRISAWPSGLLRRAGADYQCTRCRSEKRAVLIEGLWPWQPDRLDIQDKTPPRRRVN